MRRKEEGARVGAAGVGLLPWAQGFLLVNVTRTPPFSLRASSEQGRGPGVTPLTHRLKDSRAPVTAPSPMQNETGISSQLAGPATKSSRPSSKLSSATV